VRSCNLAVWLLCKSGRQSSILPCSSRAVLLVNAQLNAITYYDMTKRARDIAIAPSHSESSERQLSHDAEGMGSQDDAEGSALKKARSFMATLVGEFLLTAYCH
jgi:hypothetical protein